MNTIIKYTHYEQIIKHSKFKGFIEYVENKKQIELIMNKYISIYADANHICYAYRLANGDYRFSDAGEPKNSAGKPIYNIIEKNNLYNNIILVIRYFGGIKLGIGGLVQAYSSTASQLIKQSKFYKLINGINVIIIVKYDYFNVFIKLLENEENIIIKEKTFKDNVSISILCNNDFLDKLKKNHLIISYEVKGKYIYPVKLI